MDKTFLVLIGIACLTVTLLIALEFNRVCEFINLDYLSQINSTQDINGFIDVTIETGLFTGYDACYYCWGDIDNDNYPDLFVTRHTYTPSLLYHNLRNGTFREVFKNSGIKTGGSVPFEDDRHIDKHGCAFGDFDNDGLLDLYVSNGAKIGQSFEYNQLYRNLGNDSFSDVAPILGVQDPFGGGRNVAWADFNNDGLLDLFIANAPREDNPSVLFENNGINFSIYQKFQNESLYQPNGEVNWFGDSYGLWTDINNDGYMDLAVFSKKNGGILSIFQNSRAIGFQLTHRYFTTAFSFADFNQDGCYDILLANVVEKPTQNRNNSPHQLLINDCKGNYSTVLSLISDNVVSTAIAIEDFDNDGDPDIYLQNMDGKNVLYQNYGEFNFKKVMDKTLISA